MNMPCAWAPALQKTLPISQFLLNLTLKNAESEDTVKGDCYAESSSAHLRNSVTFPDHNRALGMLLQAVSSIVDL